jgi:cobalt/nickel transport system ATP-binding protein
MVKKNSNNTASYEDSNNTASCEDSNNTVSDIPLKKTLIDLKGISFGYPKKELILDNLDLSFGAFDKLALTGHNGSGKTTLLSVIMGLLKPISGSIDIFGKIRKTENDFQEVRPLMGFVFQDANDQLFCPTVSDDIAFGPLNMGHTREEAEKITIKVLETIGLEGFGERITHDLSGGEKKLVALGTALALNPKMLILDEPTNFLDKRATERLLMLLDILSLPYLIVSHDFDFLKKTGSKLLRLENGKIRTLKSLEDWE